MKNICATLFCSLHFFSLLLTFFLLHFQDRTKLMQKILFAYSYRAPVLAFLLPLTGLLFRAHNTASFLTSASCESHSWSTSCNPFFSNETHCMDTCELPFLLGGVMDGGVAALPAFNRDALTNRPRIRLLDKASFILTLHIPQRLCGDGEGGGVNFWRTRGGSTDGILYLNVLCLIMPEPSAWTHTNTHTLILRLDLSPVLSLETALHISHTNHLLCF